MATYAELITVLGNQVLKDKVQTAILIITDKVARGDDTGGGFDPSNKAARKTWARQVLEAPNELPDEASSHFQLLVAAKRDETPATIIAMTDAEVQTVVEEGVDLFAPSSPGP